MGGSGRPRIMWSRFMSSLIHLLLLAIDVLDMRICICIFLVMDFSCIDRNIVIHQILGFWAGTREFITGCMHELQPSSEKQCTPRVKWCVSVLFLFCRYRRTILVGFASFGDV